MSPREPAVYLGREMVSAALVLLRVDLRRDAIADAVHVVEPPPSKPGDRPGDRELTVDWVRVLHERRAAGTLTLARVARSLVDDAPVDLRAIEALDRNDRGVLAEAIEVIARPGAYQ